MKIYQKLNKIQVELKAPKNQYNSFGKYKYRSCEDILEGVKPLLQATNTVLTVADEVVNIGDRFYIKATAKLTDTEDGENVEVSALAREDATKKGMDLAQVTGSTSSYARKYALNGLFAIDDTKDSDSTNTHGKISDKPSNNSKIDSTKVKALKDLAAVKNSDIAAIENFYKMKIEEMDVVIWTQAMNYLKKK